MGCIQFNRLGRKEAVTVAVNQVGAGTGDDAAGDRGQHSGNVAGAVPASGMAIIMQQRHLRGDHRAVMT